VGLTLGVAVVGTTSAPWWTLTGCGAAVLALGLVATGARARRTAAASPTLNAV
jgi:hypothetical protein